jgi:hypothetical protein
MPSALEGGDRRLLRHERNGRESRQRHFLAVDDSLVGCAQIRLVEPSAALLREKALQSLAVEIDPAVLRAVGAVRQILEARFVDLTHRFVDRRGAELEFERRQRGRNVSADAIAAIAGVRHRDQKGIDRLGGISERLRIRKVGAKRKNKRPFCAGISGAHLPEPPAPSADGHAAPWARGQRPGRCSSPTGGAPGHGRERRRPAPLGRDSRRRMGEGRRPPGVERLGERWVSRSRCWRRRVMHSRHHRLPRRIRRQLRRQRYRRLVSGRVTPSCSMAPGVTQTQLGVR